MSNVYMWMVFSQAYPKLVENKLVKQGEGYVKPVFEDGRTETRAMEEVETGSLLKLNISE